MGSQSEELDIIINVLDIVQTLKNGPAASTNRIVDMVNLDSHNSWFLIFDLSLETR